MVRTNTDDGTNRYLERNDLSTDPTGLGRKRAIINAAERAYYKACVSDSTYHGVNHGAKVDAVASIVKTWEQFDADDFKTIDTRVDQLIAERTGSE